MMDNSDRYCSKTRLPASRVPRRHSNPLTVEHLEDRAMLAAITVTTTSDAVTHVGVSLRDAIAIANDDARIGVSSTITFGDLTGSIALEQGPIDVGSGAIGSAEIEIANNGSRLAVTGQIDGSVFVVHPTARLRVADLTFHGFSNSGTIVKPVIRNQGALTFRNVGFALNGDTIGSRCIDNAQDGFLELFDTFFAYNVGIVISNRGTLVASGCDFQKNSGESIIANTSKATIADSAFRWNDTSVLIDNYETDINQGFLAITACSFSENTGTIISNDVFSFATLVQSRILWNHGAIDTYGTMEVQGSTFANNVNDDLSGAIENGGTLSVRDSTFTRNASQGSPGRGGSGAIGSKGDLTVTNSTFYANTSANGAGAIGVRSQAAIGYSTFYGNSGDVGGGIAVYEQGTNGALPSGSLVLVNSIVAGNTATTGPDVSARQGGLQGSFNLVGIGTGVTGLINGKNGNQVGSAKRPLQPRLLPLADHGGTTKTMALDAASPAVSASGPLTRLTGSLNATDTMLSVNLFANPALIDAPPRLGWSRPRSLVIQVDEEQILIQQNDGHAMIASRGINGTVAASHAQDAAVHIPFDQRSMPRGLESAIGATSYREDQDFQVISAPSAVVSAGSTFDIVVKARHAIDGIAPDQFNGVVTLSFVDPANTMNGWGQPVTVNARNGVATFKKLASFQAGLDEALSVSVGNVQRAVFMAPIVVPGKPSQIVVDRQPPESLVAGESFVTTATLVDRYGNLAVNHRGSLAIEGFGSAEVNRGVATFTLRATRAGNSQRLTFTGAGLSGQSRPFSVAPAAAARLVWDAPPPASLPAGRSLRVAAKAVDSFGNLVTGFNERGTIGFANAGHENDVIEGPAAVDALGGVLVFDGLVMTRAETNTVLRLRAGDLPVLETNTFEVTAGRASALEVIKPPPALIASNTVFGLEVRATDAFGNPAVSFNGKVAIALAADSSGGQLKGTRVVTAKKGVALFTNLQLTEGTAEYVFTAASPGLTNAFYSPGFEAHVVVSPDVSAGRSRRIAVVYSNHGTTAIPAPLLIIGAPLPSTDAARGERGVYFSRDPDLADATSPLGFSDNVQILAGGATAGLLLPGESFTIPLHMYSVGVRPSEFIFRIDRFDHANASLIDWEGVEASVRPGYVTPAAWHALIAAFSKDITTWGEYVRMLNEQASYLADIGESTNDASELFRFALSQADGSSLLPALAYETDLAVQIPGGLSLDFSRMYGNSIVSRNTVGPLGYGWRHSWQYSIDVTTPGLITVTMPSGTRRQFREGGSTRLPSGITITNYDSMGSGDHASLQVQGQGTPDRYVVFEQDGTTLVFDDLQRFSSIANLQCHIDATYDANGNLILLTDRATDRWIRLGYVRAIALDRDVVSEVRSSDGRFATYVYTSAGEVAQTFASHHARYTDYEYVASPISFRNHALSTISLSSRIDRSFRYDDYGRLEQTFMEGFGFSWELPLMGNQVYFRYAPGRLEVDLDPTPFPFSPGHSWWTYGVNAQGQLATIVDDAGNMERRRYSATDNLEEIIGPAGPRVSFRYDDAGNLMAATTAQGGLGHFTFDRGRLTGMSDALGGVTQLHYDTRGNIIRTMNAAGKSESATYDQVGNLVSRTDWNGNVSQYSYDVGGNLLSRRFSDGTMDTYTYDAHGNLLTATNATGMITFTYDTWDRLTAAEFPEGKRLTFEGPYQLGDWIRMTDQDGFSVQANYDRLGRLESLTDVNLSAFVRYRYDSRGLVAEETRGNGTSSIYAYTPNGLIERVTNRSPAGGIQSVYGYTYENGLVSGMTSADGTWTYAYDVAGQLTSAVFASANPQMQSVRLEYSYDANGNRTRSVMNDVLTTYVLSGDGLNHYSAIGGSTFSYDDNGNVLEEVSAAGRTTYRYDRLDRLVGVTSPTDTWTFSYNALGFRQSVTHNGTTTTYVVNPTGLGDVVGIYGAGGAAKAKFVHGLGLVSQIDPSASVSQWSGDARTYYSFDGLGSTVGLTDKSGALLNTYGYMPYGEIQKSTGTSFNPFTFVGRYGVTSGPAGLFDMRARFYEARSGRFLSDDPIGLAGGSVNLRTYCANDPLTSIDPAGLAATLASPAQVKRGATEIAYELGAGTRVNGFGNPPDRQPTGDSTPPGTWWYAKELGQQLSRKAVKTIIEIGLRESSKGNDALKAGGQHSGWSDGEDALKAGTFFQRLLTDPSFRPRREGAVEGPPPHDGAATKTSGFDSNGQPVSAEAVLDVIPSDVTITVPAFGRGGQATFTVTNAGPKGSVLSCVIGAEVAGLAASTSKTSLQLASGKSEVVSVRVTGDFKPGERFGGFVTVTSVFVQSIRIEVVVLGTKDLSGLWSGMYTFPHGLSLPISMRFAFAKDGVTVTGDGARTAPIYDPTTGAEVGFVDDALTFKGSYNKFFGKLTGTLRSAATGASARFEATVIGESMKGKISATTFEMTKVPKQ